MYNAIVGSCAEQEINAGGGGGGGIAFIIAGKDSSGNTVNHCLNGGFVNPQATDGTGNADKGIWVDFITGDTGTNKGESTFATASSPSRTTQTAHIRTSELAASYNNAPQFAIPIFVGGYILQGDLGTVSNIHWQITSVSSSLSNGTSIFTLNNVSDAHEHNANNGIEDDFIQLITNGSGYQNTGIYDDAATGPFYNSGATTGYNIHSITWGGGRGSPTFPAVNDTITVRITVDADVGGTTYSKIHDFIIKFI